MHEHHRERMRKRYLTGGFDGFQSHELLEMLLYYTKARENTNPTAHALIERFGSIKNIMEATLDELEEVAGIGEQSAILIKLLTEFTKRYTEECYQPKDPSYHSLYSVAALICPKFTGLDHEQLHMLLFNNRMGILDHCIVSDGVVNSADAPARFIAERAYKKKAAFVVLAHNHPNGIAKPSPEDLAATESINMALSTLGIQLIEHFVVVNCGFYPIIHNQYKMQGLPSSVGAVGQDGSDLLEKCYNEKEGLYQLERLF